MSRKNQTPGIEVESLESVADIAKAVRPQAESIEPPQIIRLRIDLTIHKHPERVFQSGETIDPAAAGIEPATVRWLLDNEFADKA